MLVQAYNALFKDYDILLSPTSPTTAFKIGENTDDPIKMYLADVMTVPASLAGLPAVSFPAGRDAAGLPIGLQLTGQQRTDAHLLAVANTVEVSV